MALFYCPECGKQISTEAVTCPNCGYPVKKNVTPISSVDTKPVKQKKSKSFLLIVFSIIILFIIAVIFLSYRLMITEEYFEGVKWGASVEKVQKKYPDLTYEDSEDYYFTLLDSLGDYEGPIDVNFYFDSNNELYKVNASIVNDDAGDAIVYWVDQFNDIYGMEYTPAYDAKYVWTGFKTQVNMSAGKVLVDITYEKVN